VAGNGDEDDAADEQLFMQQSLELHYNVAELVGEHSSGIQSAPILSYIQLFILLQTIESISWFDLISMCFSSYKGSVFKTHGCLFTPIYLEQWHEMVTEMSHHHCLKEDRQFSFFVISDVIEFGLTPTTVASYFAR
jgi:hypothetical protein